MKYFLQNIAQSSPMRTVLLFLIGLTFWVLSLIEQENISALLVTLAIVLLNSYLLTKILYQRGATKFPSPFVAVSCWMIMSAISWLHTCWQVHLVGVSVLTSVSIMLGAKYQDEVTEEVFLISLICCYLIPSRIGVIVGIGILWILLIAKGYMTWRVWAASLIAIALRSIMMLVLHYYDWMEWLWLENIPELPWTYWMLGTGVIGMALVATILPIRKPSVASGIAYIICVVGMMLIGSILVVE